MKVELVPGGVVGRLGDVFLKAGAVGGKVGRAGNRVGSRVLVIREEGKAAACCFDVVREARYERADFHLEVEVGHSVGQFHFVLGKFGVEAVILCVKIFDGVPMGVWCFGIGWDLLGFGVIVCVGGGLCALRPVGTHAVGDFTDAGGAGDGVNLFLRVVWIFAEDPNFSLAT